MNNQQFEILIEQLQICKNEIIEKLEKIRCGIIDVESEVSNNNDKDCEPHFNIRENGRIEMIYNGSVFITNDYGAIWRKILMPEV